MIFYSMLAFGLTLGLFLSALQALPHGGRSAALRVDDETKGKVGAARLSLLSVCLSALCLQIILSLSALCLSVSLSARWQW